MFHVNDKETRASLWKPFLVPHGEVLIGFEHKYNAPKERIYEIRKIIKNTHEIRKILGRFKVAASIHNNRENT